MGTVLQKDIQDAFLGAGAHPAQLHGITMCSGEPSGNTSFPRLILVSFDGFRADYLLNFSLPNLQEFIDDGVLVREVKNVFITKTFPNHYSIVTGLYAESHGIVANSMYDKGH
ncbi:unnamed protein product [Ranitomeya imitator]|uniref:bis(5'-adenosyl)-triphosphatase n=1 Tax=Ranitomeya imitator TaxID=111125 RepID=A0ABN9LZW0_9NEOB|nr:unnamed protein product [Ranitomeya imitator]